MKLPFNFILLIIFSLSTEFLFSQSYNSITLKNEAISLMNNSRFGEAIDLLNKYVSENPNRADGFNLRGVCYERRGNFEYAVYDYRTAKKLSPNDKEITSNLNRATQDWYKLLFNKIEGHKREIAINPNTALNYLEIGKCYKNLGEWNEAEIWYDLYLEKEEASSDEILRYTEILAKNNRISKGEPLLKNYTEKFPTDHRLWSRLGYFQLWLGKNKLAIESFTQSLQIRPYFKEALDGLDIAKGKGYIYSINDTTSVFNYGLARAPKEYIIDKYFRQLKSKPENDQIRFSLIEELIKAKRFEEAKQQLYILSKKYSDDKRYQELFSKNENLRKSFYAERKKYLEEVLSKKNNDKKALLELGELSSAEMEYDLALKYYNQYLYFYPTDNNIKYKVAEILIWQNKLCEAQTKISELLNEEPENSNYNLMNANINFWLNQNLQNAEKSFRKVLSKEPSNKDALLGLAFLQLRNENLIESKRLMDELESIDRSSPELNELKQGINELESKNQTDLKIKLLDKAREKVTNGQLDDAIKSFQEYIGDNPTNNSASKELADVYLLKGDFKNAVKVYDEILKNNYDFETDKYRAKIIYWYGDSLQAVREFRKLLQKNPNDIEAKLFLGDAYLKAGQTTNAQVVYEELLKISPGSHILNTRLNWLGGSKSFSFERFPTFIQVVPQASYFVDNIKFKLSNIGLGIDFGATKNIAFGIFGSRGYLNSESESLRFNQIKGSAYIKLSEVLSSTASFGRVYFSDNNQENIVEVNLSAQNKNVYTFTLSVIFNDAAFILYSPLLVKTRLNAYYFSLSGKNKFKNGILISGKYAFIDVSDGNYGNQLQIRLGKEFEKDFDAGYEYYYYSFNQTKSLYWSPDNFESHSLWADWILFNEEKTTFALGGKVGLIPQSDFILTEFYASLNYPLIENLSFNARFTLSNSSRSNIGYRSNSIQATVFWNL